MSRSCREERMEPGLSPGPWSSRVQTLSHWMRLPLGFKRWENLAGGQGVVWPSGMTRSREAEVSKALWLQQLQASHKGDLYKMQMWSPKVLPGLPKATHHSEDNIPNGHAGPLLTTATFRLFRLF